MLNKTKIICTIGFQSEAETIMEKMLLSGMSAVRLNLAHGDLKEQMHYAATAKKVSLINGKPLAIMIDTIGPKIKTHCFEKGTAAFAKGCEVTIKTTEVLGNNDYFSVNYSGIYDDVKVDDTILVDKGGLKLRVIKKDAKTREIICEAMNSHTLCDEVFVNLPNCKTSLKYLNSEDRALLDTAIAQDMDFIGLSFVRNAQDVLEVKKIIEEKHGTMQVIAKIENAQAVENFDEILEVSDGVLIARGDLSIEVPLEDIPIVQKRIVRKCNEAGKFVIVATQMLSSMTRNKFPSRAEVSDVANAVLDGTDAIMLSNETSIGKYPVHCVETLARICARTEQEINYKSKINRALQSSEKTLNDAVALSVADTALVVNAKLIVAFTESGYTAKRISKFRPCCKIAAVTSKEVVRLGLQLHWAVNPVVSNQPTNEIEYVNKASEIATYYGVKEGENFIITGGSGTGNTNFLKVVKL